MPLFAHAIIGAGAMGTNHARVTGNIRHVDIALVVDTDEERARSLAEPLGAAWATSLPEEVTGIDTAVVAVPTELHREYGARLMASGVHVLIEKPLANSVEDAQALVDCAAANDVVLMVGHVEQFNAAILELDRWLDQVIHISSTRVGPFSGRVHEGVVFDLMIHDLDIVRRIVRSPLVDVRAIAQLARSKTEDLASALLSFENGATANITASRIGQDKVRLLEITQETETISIDLLRQDLMIRHVSQSEYLRSPTASYRQSGVVELPFIEHQGEPLLVEVQHFFDCVEHRRQPRVTGADGLESVRWALRVTEAARLSQWTWRSNGAAPG